MFICKCIHICTIHRTETDINYNLRQYLIMSIKIDKYIISSTNAFHIRYIRLPRHEHRKIEYDLDVLQDVRQESCDLCSSGYISDHWCQS
jgi:hypothetical protein